MTWYKAKWYLCNVIVVIHLIEDLAMKTTPENIRVLQNIRVDRWEFSYIVEKNNHKQIQYWSREGKFLVSENAAKVLNIHNLMKERERSSFNQSRSFLLKRDRNLL